MSQQATIDLERFRKRVETAIAQATTPRQKLARVILLTVVDGELRAGRDGAGAPSRPGIGTPAPRPILGDNGRTL